MTKDETLRMALEWIEAQPEPRMLGALKAITAIREVLAQPERKPWVGLTDDEIALICGECAASAHKTDDISYARAIEAKLKEKNHG